MYHGKGLYCDQEENVQTGEIRNGFFNGYSMKTTKGGEIRQGQWQHDKFIGETNVDNQES